MISSFGRVFALVLLVGFTVGSRLPAQTVLSLDDVVFWVGSGSQETGVVLAWNDPGTGTNLGTLAWGYRWQTSATAEDAVAALVAADPRLFMRWYTGFSFGQVVFGFGYDTNDNGTFGVSGAVDDLGNPITLVFTDGVAETLPPDSSTGAGPSDAGDYYIEGWNDNGFWELLSAPGPGYPASWTGAPVGISDLALTHEGWIALSNTEADFTSLPPGAAIAAIPEPGSVGLLVGAAFFFFCHRRPCRRG